MNEFMKILTGRKSIRSFTEKVPAKSEVDVVVEAARFAPSAKNSQKRLYTVVSDELALDRLIEVIGDACGRESYSFYGAKVFIIVSVPRDYVFGDADSSCALENMMLAAHSINLGSVWINQLRGICDDDRVRKVLNSIGIPEGHISFGALALGYPANDPVAKERTEEVRYIGELK